WQITGGGLSEAINMEAFESDIQVTDFEGLAGRFQGNNYLRVDRAESNSSALAILSSPQTRAANEGHLIRLETMFAVDPGNDTSVGFSLVDSNAPEGSTNSITLPLFTPSGAVNNRLNFP